MRVFEFKNMLIEIVVSYPASDDPVTLECCDLRSEMLFSMFRDESKQLVLHAYSDRIPLDLIPLVATIADEYM